MTILDLLFPKKCLGCGKGGQYICASCISKVSRSRLVCPVCTKPSIDGITHSKCNSPLSLNGLFSFWVYEGIVRSALLSLKYKFAFEIVKEIVSYSSPFVAKVPLPKLTMVPVPLYTKRYNWRGFNQTEEIGKRLAKIVGWNFDPNLIYKRLDTATQTGLGRRARLSNVRGSFSISTELNGENIAIFDDVWTTGSTIKEICKVLKRNGAGKVWGLTLSRR